MTASELVARLLCMMEEDPEVVDLTVGILWDGMPEPIDDVEVERRPFYRRLGPERYVRLSW